MAGSKHRWNIMGASSSRSRRKEPERFPLPRVEGWSAGRLRGPQNPAPAPVIFAGAVRHWPAASMVTPDFFRDRFGAQVVRATRFLPERGTPYERSNAAHSGAMTMADFVATMEGGERCYLPQIAASSFGGLLEMMDMDAMVADPHRIVNVWLGAGTRSGLHYDGTDNLLVQIYGTKLVALVSPEDAACVYPFGDNVGKSRVDPDEVDLRRFPRFADATLWTGELESGDVLFIPRGWWHHVCAPAAAISINCWYGQSLGALEQIRSVAAASPLLLLQIARDFVWHGAMGRPYQQRLFSPPPTGKLLYDLVRRGRHGVAGGAS